MNIETKNESNVKGEESMFNSREYMDDVLKKLNMQECDDSDRDVCTRCELETPNWDLPSGFMQPPRMPSGVLCRLCWVMAAADIWEADEANQRAAAESAGPV
jgi:hypothetical protein